MNETTTKTTADIDFFRRMNGLTPEHKRQMRAAVAALYTVERGGTVDMDAFRAAVPLCAVTAPVHAAVKERNAAK